MMVTNIYLLNRIKEKRKLGATNLFSIILVAPDQKDLMRIGYPRESFTEWEVQLIGFFVLYFVAEPANYF